MAVSPVLASGLWLRTATRCHSRRHEMQSLFCPLPSQQQHSCSSPPAFRSQTPLFTARDTGTQTVIPAALTVIVNKEHLLALFFWCVYFYLSVSSPTSSWPLSQLQRSLSKLLCFSQAVSHLHKTLWDLWMEGAIYFKSQTLRMKPSSVQGIAGPVKSSCLVSPPESLYSHGSQTGTTGKLPHPEQVQPL